MTHYTYSTWRYSLTTIENDLGSKPPYMQHIQHDVDLKTIRGKRFICFRRKSLGDRPSRQAKDIAGQHRHEQVGKSRISRIKHDVLEEILVVEIR